MKETDNKSILLLSNSFWYLYNFRLSLIKRLKKNGFQIILVAPFDEYSDYFITNKYKKSCICFAFNVINTKLGDILMSNKKEIDLIVQINNKIIRKSSDFNLIIKDAILH